MLRTAIKYLKIILFSIVALVVSYFILSIMLSVISTSPSELPCPKDKEIYVASNGLHLEIILPISALEARIQKELKLDNRVRYVSFGWGDKLFYLETPTWGDLKLSTAIKALFLKSETAMHTTHYYQFQDAWIRRNVCELQQDALIQYILGSFERDENGSIMEIPESGYTEYDYFYEANENYTCIQTCNEWVNDGLKVAGIKTSVWSPFDHGVLYHLRGE